MTEPRQRPRAKGAPIFNQNDLNELLYAFGDSTTSPLPTTISVLDEILADFIIETCHAAALCASYSRRQKIKIDDFRWVLRQNPALLGRVNEQLFREKYIKNQRRLVDFDAYGKEGAAELADIAAQGGAEKDMKAGKKGRGRKKKRKAEDEGVGDVKKVKGE
ncbi:Putative transcription initiation factor IID, subunit 13, histone-fold [Septoria linicola]|uniref:Transcription initiation factor TFIID subunit 13 n=1 Tax=Septoria linicola TaxID=215465 RepID=A0A9Q9B415_9PEZI|nr:putative transcription initiation factor IID, subunit 13, histone-fold [Septoria linicola]USW58553.1 Putative transcription initiation factor IID, subunit 13, histone-fold [Septoria linicola]